MIKHAKKHGCILIGVSVHKMHLTPPDQVFLESSEDLLNLSDEQKLLLFSKGLYSHKVHFQTSLRAEVSALSDWDPLVEPEMG